MIENKYFEGAVLVVIFLSSSTVALEDINYSSKPLLVDAAFYLDKGLTVLLLTEICIKLFSMGFISYFSNGWCWLDFIVGGLSLTDFCVWLLGFNDIPLFKVNTQFVVPSYHRIKKALFIYPI